MALVRIKQPRCILACRERRFVYSGRGGYAKQVCKAGERWEEGREPSRGRGGLHFFFVLGYTKGGVSEVRECLSVSGRNSATSLGNKSEKTLGDEDFSEYDH